jgi:hypothetical protein
VLTGIGAFDRQIAVVTPTLMSAQATAMHAVEVSRCKTAAAISATTGMSTRL